MEQSNTPAPWELTAPESYVLRYVTVTDTATEAFKLAVQELLLRGAWRMTAGHSRWGRRRWEIAAGTSAGAGEPALAPVRALHDGDPITVGRLAKRGRRTFGARFRAYTDDHVAPSLAAHGLLDIERNAGTRGRNRYARTPAGEHADTALEALLERGRRHAGRIYLAEAGMAVLLLAQLHPELRIVEKVLQTAIPADGDVSQAVAIVDADALQGLDAAFDALGAVLGGLDGGGGGRRRRRRAAAERAGCASLSPTMASAQTHLTTPQRLAAIREQMSLLSDYL